MPQPPRGPTIARGIGFYPLGGKPGYSLSFGGSLKNDRLRIAHAILRVDPAKDSLVQSPAATKLGLGEQHVDALGLDFDVDPAAATVRPFVAHVTVFFPYALITKPSIEMTVGALDLRGTSHRDGTQPKLSDVFADFRLKSKQARQLLAGGTVGVTVRDAGGTLLEQASFPLPDAGAWAALNAAAREDMKAKCEDAALFDDPDSPF